MTNKLCQWVARQRDRLKNLSPKTIVLIITILLFALLVAVALIKLVNWCICFIVANYELLLVGGFGLAAFIYWLNTRRKERREIRQCEEAKQAAAATQVKAQAEARGLETTYQLLRQALYAAINSTCDATRLNRIQSLTSLDCPRHFDSAGNYYLYHFMVTKTPNMVSLPIMQELLQNRIDQMLTAQEVPGIHQIQYLHSSGISYSIIIVDAIHDVGTFLQIDVVTANRHYCEFKESYLSIRHDNSLSLQDDDF